MRYYDNTYTNVLYFFSFNIRLINTDDEIIIDNDNN